MQIGRSRQSGSWIVSHAPDGCVDRVAGGAGETDGCSSSSSPSPSSASITTPHPVSPSKMTACGNYIEHWISKMDTLAGVAIKYGVEVSDIRRLNALVTDRQMFAHKSIKIPLPGRHPPSPVMTNGSARNGDQSSKKQPQIDLESFHSTKLRTPQRKVSPAMSSLQGYYGLVTSKSVPPAEGTEMAVYRNDSVVDLEDQPLLRVPPISDLHANSRTLGNGFSSENGNTGHAALGEKKGETDRSRNEKSIRRRQKVEAESPLRGIELLSEDEDGTLSGRTAKGSAQSAPRPKSGSRTDLDSSFLSATSTGDSFITNGFLSVRKSSSTSDLQESDNGSSIWPTSKWSLKPDAIAKPLFDGLPRPMTPWKSKAALD